MLQVFSLNYDIRSDNKFTRDIFWITCYDGEIMWRSHPVTVRWYEGDIVWRRDPVTVRSYDGEIVCRRDPMTVRSFDGEIMWRWNPMTVRWYEGDIIWRRDPVTVRSYNCEILWRWDRLTTKSFLRGSGSVSLVLHLSCHFTDYTTKKKYCRLDCRPSHTSLNVRMSATTLANNIMCESFETIPLFLMKEWRLITLITIYVSFLFPEAEAEAESSAVLQLHFHFPASRLGKEPYLM